MRSSPALVALGIVLIVLAVLAYVAGYGPLVAVVLAAGGIVALVAAGR